MPTLGFVDSCDTAEGNHLDRDFTRYRVFRKPMKFALFLYMGERLKNASRSIHGRIEGIETYAPLRQYSDTYTVCNLREMM
ncbi:hypothetical protein SUGI_0974320 [Cryptomeria japonica]|nr:hypothetical protein SUGI_0974320 [Cryptomeria japonica]